MAPWHPMSKRHAHLRKQSLTGFLLMPHLVTTTTSGRHRATSVVSEASTGGRVEYSVAYQVATMPTCTVCRHTCAAAVDGSALRYAGG